MPTKKAAHAGEAPVQLNLAAAWREETVFTDAGGDSEPANLRNGEIWNRARRSGAGTARSIEPIATPIADNFKEKHMNVALWIVAGLLAAVFLFAGFNKVAIPREKLGKAPGGGWVWDFSAGFIKALGVVEILGAIGLVLPALLDIAPVLVPLAAVGVGLIMIGAAIMEVRRQEPKHALVNLAYLALAGFVAFGRFLT